MLDVLDSTLNGTATLDERRMFRAKVTRGSNVIADRFVLNDVVIGKSSRSPIVDLSISVRGHFVISSRADGVILSTPTGSTAYNLAGGGPIVHPTVDAVVITPIAPHTLTNRPIVLCDDAPIVVTPDLNDDHLEISASFDGQLSIELQNGDDVVVERADNPLRVIRSRSRNYFAVLREKLKWGER
jgi:NAD+ kinase